MKKVQSFGERLAQTLVEDGFLSADAAEELLDRQQREGVSLLKLINQRKDIDPDSLTLSMGRVLKTPPINLAQLRIPAEIIKLVPIELAKNHKIIPVFRFRERLFVAMTDPLNVLALDDLRRVTGLEIAPLIASEHSIVEQLNRSQANSKPGTQANQSPRHPSPPASVETVEVADDSAVDWANRLLRHAISHHASDIHVEPTETDIRVRYRIDGSLVESESLAKDLAAPLLSRLKIMSQLDIAERRLPQDGRLRVDTFGKSIDVRCSFVPTVHGEKCVLRLLDNSNVAGDLDHLGMEPNTLLRFKTALDAPHGLILVTGPTGSGKTTTLYSAISQINDPRFNIVTVEDPVEFQIRGIVQIPIDAQIGLTFASALRAILRQDPDIIMIGEVRDQETAAIAVESALTGHQVLSTMHCNSAAGAIARLDEMQIAPFLIASSVTLACSQRLMRSLCSFCREPLAYAPEVYEEMGISPSLFENCVLYKGTGCGRCGGRGYAGRAAIIEAMTVTRTIRNLIISRAPSADLERAAVEEGMARLRDVALLKVRQGISSLEEAILSTADSR